MTADHERAALRDELRTLDDQIQRMHADLEDLRGDMREPDEGASAGRIVLEQLQIVEALETRRDEIRRRLGMTPAPVPDPLRPSGRQARGGVDLDDDALKSFDDDPATLPHEGRGEDLDPAVWPEEWTARRGDQISEAADVDDPVEALEVGGLWAGTEADPSGDATELADRAAPAPPEEAALTERGDARREFDDLTITLPPGADLQRLEDAALDELVEAELVAIDQGDPETAAIIAAEIDLRRRAR